jgi:hypothetical protein
VFAVAHVPDLNVEDTTRQTIATGSLQSRRDFVTNLATVLAFSAIPEASTLANAFTTPHDDKDAFSKIRGVNYYPSWTPSLPDLWVDYRPSAVEFELSLARSIGVNAVRVWLGTTPWDKLGDKMLDRISHFLETSRKLGLKVMPCIFDSCGVEASSYSGEVVPLQAAYRRLMSSPAVNQPSRDRIKFLAGPYAETVGRDSLCPYSEQDPSVLLWQWHAPSPGYSKLDPKFWPTSERYLRAILKRFGNHPAVMAWDLMNEPCCIKILSASDNGGAAFDKEVVYRFIGRMREVVDSMRPLAPITYGAESAQTMHDLVQYSDVLSFHTYESKPEKLAAMLDTEREFATQHQKPLLLTESIATLFVNSSASTGDGPQVDLFRECLPVIEKASVGYFLVALMEGRFPFAWVGFFRPDGTRKPVADYIESVLKPSRS